VMTPNFIGVLKVRIAWRGLCDLDPCRCIE
jgi:hypothetical protein